MAEKLITTGRDQLSSSTAHAHLCLPKKLMIVSLYDSTVFDT